MCVIILIGFVAVIREQDIMLTFEDNTNTIQIDWLLVDRRNEK